MDEKISVVIADDNAELGDLLMDFLRREADIEVKGVARDGVEAVDMIVEHNPDIVILDIVMPNLDGIGVLEKVSGSQMPKKPLFIMLSAIGQDSLIQRAMELKADYYIVKPFDLGILAARIRQAYREKYLTSITYKKFKENSCEVSESPKVKYDAEKEITDIMLDIGVPAHMAGYQYIREAILQSIKSPKELSPVTKVIYPTVAKKFGTSPEKVERAIRNAIEATWSRGNHDSFDMLFGYTLSHSRGKPTNSEFIAMIADRVKLKLKSINKK